MTDLVNISDFSYQSGLNIGQDTRDFTYMYGLSDFWHYLFQDTSLNNLLLEASTVQASDIYNNFLQLCSGISLENLAESASSQLRLEIISDTPILPKNIPIETASFLPTNQTWNISTDAASPEIFMFPHTVSNINVYRNGIQ